MLADAGHDGAEEIYIRTRAGFWCTSGLLVLVIGTLILLIFLLILVQLR